MARGETTTAAAAGTPATEQYVSWTHANHFEARELTAADTKTLGATEGKKLRWDQENGWRVKRSDVPLTDQQLADFMEADSRFKLVEG